MHMTGRREPSLKLQLAPLRCVASLHDLWKSYKILRNVPWFELSAIDANL